MLRMPPPLNRVGVLWVKWYVLKKWGMGGWQESITNDKLLITTGRYGNYGSYVFCFFQVKILNKLRRTKTDKSEKNTKLLTEIQ